MPASEGPRRYVPVPGVIGPDEADLDGRAHTLEEARSITRRRVRDLGALLQRTVRRHLPPPPPPPAPPPTTLPALSGRLGRVLPLMRTIPWVLGATFAVSFAWDFPGTTVTLLGRPLALEGLLRILSVSGLIGFGTNWLAITMLFRPREKRPILPQGLIPAQRERVVVRLAQAVSRELINADIIKERIEASGVIRRYREQAVATLRAVVEDPAFRADLKGLTADYVESVLGSERLRRQLTALAAEKIEAHAGQGLGGLALRLYRSLNEADFQRRLDQAVRELPAAVEPLLDRLDEALDRLPALVDEHVDTLEELATRTVLGFVERMDVYGMIVQNARRFDERRLEDLLKRTSNEQLHYIKYLGGVLGVVGGFVIWEPLLALTVLAVLALSVWGLDEGLHRLRRAPA